MALEPLEMVVPSREQEAGVGIGVVGVGAVGCVDGVGVVGVGFVVGDVRVGVVGAGLVHAPAIAARVRGPVAP